MSHFWTFVLWFFAAYGLVKFIFDVAHFVTASRDILSGNDD
jgi:hypothetical protein